MKCAIARVGVASPAPRLPISVCVTRRGRTYRLSAQALRPDPLLVRYRVERLSRAGEVLSVVERKCGYGPVKQPQRLMRKELAQMEAALLDPEREVAAPSASASRPGLCVPG